MNGRFISLPDAASPRLPTASGSRTVTENMKTIQLKIEGMTCESCTSIAEKAILEVPGVLAADVDFEKNLATVGTDKGSLISADQIMQALRRVGYGARLLGSQAEKELHSPAK